MVKPKPRLKVLVEGNRRYISVPSGHAGELHTYLRGNRVGTSPPEPASTGLDSIELTAGTDTKVIQQLLDAWI